MTNPQKSTAPLAGLLLLALLAAIVALCIGLGSSSRDWSAQLLALARQEAPLSDAQRQDEHLDLTRLAERDDAVLLWLVGVLTSGSIDRELRVEALWRLGDMHDDEAVVRMARALVPWLDHGWDSREKMMLQGNVRMPLYWMLLQTDLPTEELHELAVHIHPGGMPGPGRWPVDREPPTPSMSDMEKKQQRRQEELLQYARSLGGTKLLQRLEAEGPLPEGAAPALSALPTLAEQHPALRKSLARVVASPKEDLWVRGVAFRALLNVHSDEAVRGILADLGSWFWDREVELNRDGRDFQEDARDFMLDRLLLTDLPTEDVSRMAKQWQPFWDDAAGTVTLRYQRGYTPWSPEQHLRLQERARQLMRLPKTGKTPHAATPSIRDAAGGQEGSAADAE